MIDIKNTALFLVGVENKETFAYQGINIFESKNNAVYSQSILTNQRQDMPIDVDWAKRLNKFTGTEHKNKSYSIINDSYNLIVGDHGVEFFMHRADPGNYSNLLDFFEIDHDGKITRFNHHGAWRGHLRTVLMQDDQIYDIMKNYYQLRSALMERINVKHGMIDSSEKNFFDMEIFNRIRPRGFIWK
jgi:hypothetical protein